MRNSDDDICSEKKCAVKLTEGGVQSIYCDVCSKIYCLENKFNEKCLEMDAIIKRFEDVGEKIEQTIDIKITEKLMNKMEAKLEKKN